MSPLEPAMTRIICIFAALWLSSQPNAAWAGADLPVTLPSGASVTLAQNTLVALERHSVAATAHGEKHRYEGTDLRLVLQAAGATPTDSLRGALLKRTVTIEGADGYRAVFALSELDPTIGDKRVILTDSQDGAALPALDGPWQIVVPSDNRPARWVRQVIRIIVSDVP
jgi:hypothetical protein